MEGDVRIRDAAQADCETLCAVIRGAFRDVAVRFRLTVENCPKHPSNYSVGQVEFDLSRGTRYFLLEEGGKPCGCVAMEMRDAESCYMMRLAVLPEARRKGFGRRLVDGVTEEASHLGLKWIHIGVIADDEELVAWYRRLGFTEVETRQFPHLPFLVLFMVRGVSGTPEP